MLVNERVSRGERLKDTGSDPCVIVLGEIKKKNRNTTLCNIVPQDRFFN